MQKTLPNLALNHLHQDIMVPKESGISLYGMNWNTQLLFISKQWMLESELLPKILKVDKNNLFPKRLWFPYSCKRISSLQTAWKNNEINILILTLKCMVHSPEDMPVSNMLVLRKCKYHNRLYLKVCCVYNTYIHPTLHKIEYTYMHVANKIKTF